MRCIVSVLAATALGMSGLLLAAPPAAAAAGCNTTTPTLGQTVTCTTYGTESITVPSGAGSVSVVAIGGGGGGGAAGNNVARAGSGGGGAVVTATFALGQGTSALSIRVGGGGGAGQNYWHYGAWGGGFSAVSVSGTPLAIAGGGGGGGTGPNGNTGGDGGDGGGIGGVGNNGDDGGNNGAQGGRGGGGAGGPGGAGGAGIPNGGQPFDGTAGAAWSAGGGGGASSSSSYGGGNGGGGYGGGGGGGVDGSLSGGHGGGGAGGSFADATALIGSATYGTATTGAGAPGAGTPAGTTANGSNGVDGQVQLTFNGAPVVTSVSPGNGPVAGGTSIHVDGTDLSGATSVTFGTTSATITANTATRVTVTLPSGFGTKDVSVTTPNGTGTKANAFTYDSPTITGVSPSPISALGGTSMYVDGTNLLYATGVTFGGVAGTITNTTDTRVTVTAPASSVAGAVDVVVMSQGASNVTAVGAVTYTASKPTPPTIGTATAGVRQAAVSWTAPTFDGGSTITGYTVTSNPDSLTCTTTGATTCTVTGLTNLGTYTFTVTATNSVGTSLASSASPSVTLVAPTITHASINPTMGSALGGTQVTITGANLAGASSVTFGGVAGTIQSTTSTTIVVLTPPSNQSTSVDVVVTVNSVTATVQSGFTYTQSGPSAPTNIVAALAGSDGATPTSPAEPTTPNAPTPTTTPTVRPTMPATLAAATIPGLRLPMRITVPGTTILVRQTLRTSDGTVVTARATVQRVAASTTSRALPPAKATGTRIVNGRNGRISVVTTGRYPVVVTLRLTAPATSTSAALRQTKIWRVPAKRQ